MIINKLFKIDEEKFKIRKLLNIMVKRYTWLTIKFEYNENKQQYLVSYSPKDRIQSDNEFMTDSMMLEYMFNDFLENMHHCSVMKKNISNYLLMQK